MDYNQNQEVEVRLARLESKIEALDNSIQKLLKYFQITAWVTLALVVLPALGLVFVIPAFLNSYLGALDGLL